MRSKNFLSAISTLALTVVFFASVGFAQEEPVKTQTQVKSKVKSELKTQSQVQSKKFIDANGDGYNDNAPDIDGDGIPNGRDEDYTGTKNRKNGKGFVDLNGDGLNDNAFDSDGDGIPNGQDADFVSPQDGTGQKNMKGKNNHSKFGGNKYGPGNGTGTGVGPKDGTGYGSGNGTGTCDGTGPKGKRGGR